MCNSLNDREYLNNNPLTKEIESRLKRGIENREVVEKRELTDTEKKLYLFYQKEKDKISEERDEYYIQNKELIDKKDGEEYKKYIDFTLKISRAYHRYRYRLGKERSKISNQNGSVSIIIALLLIPFLTITFYLIDGQRLLHTKQTARNIAEEAARTGQVVAKQSLRGGKVNPDVARVACQDYIDNSSINGGSCTIVDDNKLQVDVNIDFKPMFPDNLNASGTISREADLLVQ